LLSEEKEVERKALPLSQVSTEKKERLKTGFEELDRVLGGGLVPGSVSLIGGEPGTGKSTLLLQAAYNLTSYGKVLYISGEESARQIKMRADRLDLESEEMLLYSGQNMERAMDQALELEPVCMIVDSIQALSDTNSEATLGSTKQVRELGSGFTRLAKEKEIATLLVGHITKSGEFAGPKAIEHLVDATFYFEGEKESQVRLLRPQKNRFGSTDGLGLFQMTEKGLREILNPSQFFANRDGGNENKKGSAVVCIMEGKRPILAEVQALVTPPNYSGNSQRRTTGLDYNRASLLLAVLEKQLELNLGGADVYLNVVGGFSVNETAADLGVIAAVLSSYSNLPLGSGGVFVGEVGLSGEVRPVKNLSARLNEVSKLGYERFYFPSSSNLQAEKSPSNREESEGSTKLRPVESLSDLYRRLKGRG